MGIDWQLELRKTWLLQRDPPDDGTVHAHVLTTEAGRPLRVYTSVDRARHLLVPGDFGDVVTISGDALRCEVRTVVFEGTAGAYLDISCHQQTLFEVFDDLLASIIASAVESGDPLAAATEMLGRWRELLRAWSANMPHEREMGLFAELHVLELATRRAPQFRPGVWRGPLREPKDLVANAWWVEVKAAAPSKRTVWINGPDQLSDLEGLAGYLAVVTVEEDGEGRTVDEVAEMLRRRSTKPSDFDDLLLHYGWVGRDDAKRWRAVTMDVITSGMCPRLAVDPQVGVPAGIGRIRYELDLVVARSVALVDGEGELLRMGESS